MDAIEWHLLNDDDKNNDVLPIWDIAYILDNGYSITNGPKQRVLCGLVPILFATLSLFLWL